MKREIIYGKIYDIQGFSVHDGPGIRTTVFLKGCPLRCPWCHSPESQSFRTQMSFMDMRCVGAEKCGLCLNVCPTGALTEGETTYSEIKKEYIRHIHVNRSLCTDCGKCAEVCYANALFLCGRDYTAEELMEKIRKDKSFFERSGGGVTISGGEPMCQSEFTTAVLKACTEEGIHTALDTTGYVGHEVMERALPYVGLFLYDLKHMNSERHKLIVGVPNERILDNARRLAQAGGKFCFRIPVIPGFNDSEENLRAVGAFCGALGDCVETVQLLPYHHFGATKYERLQMEDPMPDSCVPPPAPIIEGYAELLRSYGLHVIIH